MFLLALDGVTRWGLMAGIERIIKGGLGHAFMPSPPELRQAIDREMIPHAAERERIERREKLAEEAAAFGPIPKRTPEQIARVKAIYDRFSADYETQSKERMERDEVRARHGMTDEVLSKIPDRPLPGFRRLGE